MQLPDDQVCALIGNVQRAVQSTADSRFPCVYYLESWKNGQTILHGARGTHVDDGICGGDS